MFLFQVIFRGGGGIENSESIKIIKKAIYRLVIPFFIWNFIYGIIAIFAHSLFGIEWCNASKFWHMILIQPFTYGNVFFNFNAPSWFLLMLFEVKLIDCIIRKLFLGFKYEKLFSNISYFLIAICAVNIARIGTRTAFEITITRAGYMLFWFEIGKIYKQYLEKKDNYNNIKYFMLVFMVQGVLLLICRKNGMVAGVWNSEFTNGPILTILAAGTGIAFYLRLSRVLVPSFKDSRLIRYISTHTFSIMMHQFAGFFLLNLFFLKLTEVMGIAGFDKIAFQKDFWYRYCPGNLYCFRMLYVFCGVALPLLGCKIYEKYIKNKYVLKGIKD